MVFGFIVFSILGRIFIYEYIKMDYKNCFRLFWRVSDVEKMINFEFNMVNLGWIY